MKCQKSTDKIILHQLGLEIEKKVLINQLPIVTNPPSIIEVQEHKYDASSNLYIMKLKKSLKEDTNYKIEIEFSGYFSNSEEGLSSLAYVTTSIYDLK